MTVERQRLRTVDDVVDGLLWPPQGGLLQPDLRGSTRQRAIAEVLCCIPQDDYESLADSIDSWMWFVPDTLQYAMVYPFPATVYPEPDPKTGVQYREYAQVLYLSALLEERAMSFVVATVAHELAHVFLDHRSTPPVENYDAQEEEAWELVRQWGFEREAREHHRYYRWRESWEETYIHKLKEALGYDQ